MKTWEKTLIHENSTLRSALQIIDASGVGIAIVVDEDRRLVGTLTDGDVRRALIGGSDLEDPASCAVNREPRLARVSQSSSTILAKLREFGLHQIPLVDDDGVVAGLVTIDDFLKVPERPNWVVIMAGGRGERLSELTQSTPKPMLPVGNRPILETIVMNYIAQGFRKFYFAVNYKAEQIEAHFGDGSSRAIEIRYLREEKQLGTGGALSLISERPDGPIIVSNGDLLSKEDYGHVLDAHVASGADATVLVRTYDVQIPFGVITQSGPSVVAIEEKPTHSFTINAGVYVLSPRALDLVPTDTFFDLPTLLESMIAKGMRVRSHSAQAYWMDIGRMPDFERANAEFQAVFE